MLAKRARKIHSLIHKQYVGTKTGRFSATFLSFFPSTSGHTAFSFWRILPFLKIVKKHFWKKAAAVLILAPKVFPPANEPPFCCGAGLPDFS
jgi:hypothetical protein